MQNLTLLLSALTLALATEFATADLFDNRVEGASFARAPLRQVRGYALTHCNKCPPNQCQVLGMQRYAVPTCEALGTLGAPCRMWQEPENKTLHYPDSIMRCQDVYMQLCPCAQGLVCEEAQCRRASTREATLEDAEANLEAQSTMPEQFGSWDRFDALDWQ